MAMINPIIEKIARTQYDKMKASGATEEKSEIPLYDGMTQYINREPDIVEYEFKFGNDMVYIGMFSHEAD